MALFHSRRHPARLIALTIALSSVVGCLDRPIGRLDPHPTTTVQEKLPRGRIDKIDLLLMIDNSGSMADKQAILAQAVPDLVKGLVLPRCVDEGGTAAEEQPASPIDKCPTGTEREFEPVLDIHIGIISSSLGGHGADSCPESGPQGKASNNDHAHLLSRKDPENPDPSGGQVETYQNKGFLAWDPAQKLSPPGTKEIGDTNGASGLVPTLRDLVTGVGQKGCGFEAQLESWYRFLVDPEPYQSIQVEDGKAVMRGVDDVLLTQRAEFLRPSSLVAIIMLTDENDCSLTEGGKYYLGAQFKDYHPPRARRECAADPNDPCCKPCGAPLGECPADPTCDASSAPVDDPSNLRCFDQKRRFGVDFLYPLDRYTNAIQLDRVPNRAGELVRNPLYPTVEGSLDPKARTPDDRLVFLAGIVGVPWQDIARRDENGKPSLLRGFKSPSELSKLDAAGLSTWDLILGDPARNVLPRDPLMIESRAPRAGVSPVTGESIAPVDSPRATANSINGHEWNTDAMANGDLQYACIFPLPTPQQGCTGERCECRPEAKNPLCQDDQGQYTVQLHRAKAYPGLRELGVLKGVGEQGIVASVCPAQVTAVEQLDFGYRPAIGAIVDQLKRRLGGPCLRRSLTPNDEGQVSCLILEARKLDPGQACTCGGPDIRARQDVQPEHLSAKRRALSDPVAEASDWDCFCEIKQLSGDALKACQYDTRRAPLTSGGEAADGYCYIDATTFPRTGDPSLVDNCPATEQRKIRFVGAGQQLPGSTLFISCSGEQP
jgi:hypothetical protein